MTKGLKGRQIGIARDLLRSYFGGVYTAERLSKMSDEDVRNDVRTLHELGRGEKGIDGMKEFLFGKFS